MAFANAFRGLKIVRTDFEYLSEGALSLVFVDRTQRKVWKVARADRGIPRSHFEQVFQTEVKAYEIAIASDELRNLVPRFYGITPIPGIVDSTGKDVLREVHLDLAFQIEFIDCRFEKLSVQSDDLREFLGARFRKHGIWYTLDSSVCLCNGVVSKIIDFATGEVELLQE